MYNCAKNASVSTGQFIQTSLKRPVNQITKQIANALAASIPTIMCFDLNPLFFFSFYANFQLVVEGERNVVLLSLLGPNSLVLIPTPN